MKKLIKKIIHIISKKSSIFRRTFKKARFQYKKNKYKKITKDLEIDQYLIVFEAYQGRKIDCTPRALYLELLNNPSYSKYHFIWAVKEPEKYQEYQNARTKIVKYASKEYLEAYGQAKYWFVNAQIPLYITPKKEQIFLQCWHGTPLKRLRCDIKIEGGGSALNSLKDIHKENDIDARRYTYFLSPSAFATEKFTSAFNLEKLGKKNIIIEKGYPRNDFLFQYKDSDIQKIKKELNIPPNKKVILYAPTFRDHEHKSGVGYTYDLGLDFDRFFKIFKKDYIILFRAHYYVASSFDFSKYQGLVYNVSDYNNINNLYIISDILLTDYSSVFFDYANLKRPIIFYMYDYEDYKYKMRDFYFDIDILPGPITKNQNELHKAFKKIDNYYDSKYKEFNKKFNYLDNKDCSEKVLKEVIK